MVRAKPRASGKASAKSQQAESAVAETTDDSLKPLGPAPAGVGRWKPVQSTKTLVVSGGYSKKPCTVESMDVGDDVFIKLDKNAEWLLKMVGGAKLAKGGMSKTTAIEMLRKQSGLDAGSPARKNSVPDADDPMHVIDDCVYEGDASGSKAKKTYYQPKRTKDRIMVVSMPTRSVGRCAGKMTDVKLLPTSKNSLWIHSDSLPWLVSYLADEYSRCGVAVPQVTPDEKTKQGNCSVPGLVIRWDFASEDGWEAVWVDGAFQGEVVRSTISSLTQSKWKAIGGVSKFGVELDQASLKDRKNAVWLFLEMHCASLLSSVQTAGSI
jgi:hypothetical protein